MNNIKLQINGIDWHGWLSMQVTRSIEAISGGFSLGLTEKWQEKQKRMPISCGMECKLLIGDDELICGYVDMVNHSFDANSHAISVSGRDKSADLVDCCALHASGQFLNANALEIANYLAEPFGVNVLSEVALGEVFKSFKLETGEKALDALMRALKQRELLAIPYMGGHLRLAKLGEKSMNETLIQGKNVISASLNIDVKARYSDYICHGQQQGNDEVYGKACSCKASIKDEEIARYRPMIVRSSQQGDARFMKKRAEWECKVNRAKSINLNVKVQGFRTSNGELWDIGKKIEVKLPYFGLEKELLLVSTTFSKSKLGTFTELSLKDLDVYSPEPIKKSTALNSSGDAGDLSILIQQSKDAKIENDRITYEKMGA